MLRITVSVHLKILTVVYTPLTMVQRKYRLDILRSCGGRKDLSRNYETVLTPRED